MIGAFLFYEYVDAPENIVAILVLGIAYQVFSRFNWRCPACGGKLKRFLRTPSCRNCGARLV